MTFDSLDVYTTSIGLVSLSLVFFVMHVELRPFFCAIYFTTLILLAVATIENLTISFDNNNYSVYSFKMVIIPFGSTK